MQVIFRPKVMLDQEKADVIDLVSKDIRELKKHCKNDPLLQNTIRELSGSIKDLKSPHLDYGGRVQLLVSTLHRYASLDICRTLKGEDYSKRFLDYANKFKGEITPEVETVEWRPENTKESDYGFPESLRDKYHFDAYIGEGGFGKVYRVLSRQSGHKSAIKVIENKTESGGHSFINEVTTWQNLLHDLKHGNIVEIIDANISPTPYIEMEYIDGGTLGSLAFPMKREDALWIIFRVLDGLKYAHDHKILHLDLKPNNILLTKDGVPKIGDWGQSKLYTDHLGGRFRNIGFTMAYAAPEQVLQGYGNSSFATDIYQIGTILYQLLTGKHPLKLNYESFNEFTREMETQQPVPLSGISETLSDIDPVVSKCLKKRPQDRYSNVMELKKDIGRLLGFEEEKREEKVSDKPVNVAQSPVGQNHSEWKQESTGNIPRNNHSGDPTKNINININLSGSMPKREPETLDNKSGIDPEKTRSLPFAVGELRTLFKTKDYAGAYNFISNHLDYIREKKPSCMKQLEENILPNLEVKVRFGFDFSHMEKNVESFLSCLEK